MSDPVSQNWFLSAVSATLAMSAGIFEYFRRKVDDQEKRLNKIPETYVTRADLTALEARIELRAAASENRSTAQHSDNTNNFRELRLQLESVNTKLFELAAKK